MCKSTQIDVNFAIRVKLPETAVWWGFHGIRTYILSRLKRFLFAVCLVIPIIVSKFATETTTW